MKRFTLVAAASLSMLCISAESVTVEHTLAGSLSTEIEAVLTADQITVADITELKITGEAELTADDCTYIRTNMKTTLVLLDVSEAVFAGDKLPGGQWDGTGKFVNGMTALTEVKLPETLIALGGPSFNGCTKLERVNLNDNIHVIPNKCFSGCSKLTLEALPANLTTIESEAFRSCASLTLSGSLPATLTSIRNFAFCDSKVAFDQLPANLATLEQNAFQRTNVSFSEIPAGIKTLNQSVFAGTQVTFDRLPEHITAVSSYVFQSVKTMPEFTITDQAGLWSTIPMGFFFIAADDTPRTFICRAPQAPNATVNVGSDKWTGSFSQVSDNSNTTFKVLESALESYQNKAPYNTMNLEVLTTSIPAPVSEIDYGHFTDHVVINEGDVVISYEVNGTEYTDLTDVPESAENAAAFNVNFSATAPMNIYVKEIRYAGVATQAEGSEDESEGSEDPDVLYTATSTDRENVSVPVTVGPDMRPMQVVIAQSDNNTVGIEAVEAQANIVSRKGNMIYLSEAGASLFDLAGRSVATTEGSSLSMEQLPGGVYILRAGNTVVKIVK